MRRFCNTCASSERWRRAKTDWLSSQGLTRRKQSSVSSKYIHIYLDYCLFLCSISRSGGTNLKTLRMQWRILQSWRRSSTSCTVWTRHRRSSLVICSTCFVTACCCSISTRQETEKGIYIGNFLRKWLCVYNQYSLRLHPDGGIFNWGERYFVLPTTMVDLILKHMEQNMVGISMVEAKSKLQTYLTGRRFLRAAKMKVWHETYSPLAFFICNTPYTLTFDLQKYLMTMMDTQNECFLYEAVYIDTDNDLNVFNCAAPILGAFNNEERDAYYYHFEEKYLAAVQKKVKYNLTLHFLF